MMHETPPVIVCVPVRNGARTIQRTLDSILAQDYPNIEVIVSDNYSTDDTARIVQKYSAYGVRYYLNPKLEACGESNWNYILSLAQSPFIALYHADDIYTPTMVRRQVEFLKIHVNVSAVFTMIQTIDAQDRPIKLRSMRLPKELYGRDCFAFLEFFNAVLKYGTFTPVPTMMTRRAVIDTVGGFRWQMFASASDIDLYLRMAKQWGPIGIIYKPLCHYRITPQQGSARLFNNRVKLADFFVTLNSHLNNPEERIFAQPKSLVLYEMQRASDHILCAMNLLVQGQEAEARTRLHEALKWRHFVTARQRPRLFARFLIGMGFLASTYLGLGPLIGRWVYHTYQHDLQRRRQPLKE